MKRIAAILALCLSLFALAGNAAAREASPVGADPALQERMMKLASVLRCLQCQNQTIADSHADLAEDLRKEMLELMKQGKSDEEITQFLVARYGDFVLYRPPLKPSTWLLWAAPALLVALGVVLAARAARRHRLTAAGERPLDDEQRRLADQLLDAEDEGTV